MRAPKKVIAAIAMATMIGGTGLQAFAADPVGFEESSGVNGQNPLQTSTQYKADKSDLGPAEGYIQVNGSFDRTVSSFPTEKETGRYLQVTMPILLNYTYDLGKETLTAANGKITNQSVYLNELKQPKKQAVKMSVIGLEDARKSMENIKYVSQVVQGDSQNVQVPFEVVITKNGQPFQNISLESLEKGVSKTFKVEANTDLDITIGQINKQKVLDEGGLLNNQKASMGHKLKMRFEYDGE